MDRLIVKNFGPLKDIDIELNKINLFIGENGSGKSVLAKLITILSNFSEIRYEDESDFIKLLTKYNINYINDSTIIEKENFVFKDGKLENKKKEKKDIDIESLPIYNRKKLDTLRAFSNGDQTIVDSMTKYKYLPAERNLISLFSKSLSSFFVADIPIPKFLLEFMSDFEKATNEINALEILNIKYINAVGLDRHKIYFNNKDYLPLEQSSSGIQSAIPMLLTTKYFAKKYRGIVIEEPEQNLFPKAQDEVVKFIVKQVNSKKSNLFLMTHSPYVLSTLNNLIFAHKVSNLNDKAKEQVEELIKEEQWINPDSFSAYFLKDGVAKSIVSKRGLISDNIIDDVSDEVDREFEELMETYREYKQ